MGFLVNDMAMYLKKLELKREIHCKNKECNKQIITTSRTKEYCDECAKERRKAQLRINNQRLKERKQNKGK